MQSRSTRQLVLGGGILLALVGLWLGHTVEYARVWGTSGLSTELFGSIHAYMLPLAGVIALLAAAFATRLWRIWARLGQRLDTARARLAAAMRGRPVDDAPTPASFDLTPSISSRIAVAWPALTLLQVALYLFQENIEAVAGGMPAPGISAIAGVHALAPLIHAAVALALLLLAAATIRILRRRVTAIDAVESLVLALLTFLRQAPRVTTRPFIISRAPLQLFGAHLASRPPPGLLGA